jgi:hypothetical protein
VSVQIQLRRGSAATWTSQNPILAEGEAGIEIDTRKFKFGDGATHWASLPYASASAGANAAWGSVTGTLSDQTDLQEALEAKQDDLGYTAEDIAHKDASGGYAGLTLFKLNLRNALGTVTSWFTTAATGARTWAMPDKDGTVAMTSDVATAQAAAESYADTAVAALVNAAPGTLDTLKELADAIGDDANYAASTATALGNRVRVDTAAQGLSGTEKSNARTNLGLGSAATSATGDFDAAGAAATAQAYAIQRGNHTGTQLAATISDFAATVRATVLTGLSTAAGTVVDATHTVLQALGFLQNQVSANTTAIAGKQAALVSGTNIKTINSTSLLGSGDIAISASPGGSNTQLQYNNAGSFSGAAGITTDGNVLTDTQAVGATSTDGIVLATSTAATVGAQKMSPRIRWTGNGWKTNSTAASQAVDFIAEVQPVQGAANPTGKLVFSYQVNGGGFTIGPSLGTDGSILTPVNTILSIGIAVSGQPVVGIGRNGSVTGLDLWGDSTSGQPTINVGTNHMTLKSTSVIGFTASAVSQTIDAGVTRSASTLIAITKSTSQSDFGDLKLRGLWFGSTLTVGTLPSAASSEGLIYRVSDSLAPAVGSTVASGGSAKCTVQAQSSAWQVIWI